MAFLGLLFITWHFVVIESIFQHGIERSKGRSSDQVVKHHMLYIKIISSPDPLF